MMHSDGESIWEHSFLRNYSEAERSTLGRGKPSGPSDSAIHPPKTCPHPKTPSPVVHSSQTPPKILGAVTRSSRTVEIESRVHFPWVSLTTFHSLDGETFAKIESVLSQQWCSNSVQFIDCDFIISLLVHLGESFVLYISIEGTRTRTTHYCFGLQHQPSLYLRFHPFTVDHLIIYNGTCFIWTSILGCSCQGRNHSGGKTTKIIFQCMPMHY